MLAFGSLLLLTLAQAETLQLTGSATWQAGTFSDTEENSAGHLSMGVSSDWFDTSWSHRTAITVQENSGTDLADYSVSITLDTASLVSAGTLSSDGSDLRRQRAGPLGGVRHEQRQHRGLGADLYPLRLLQ